MKNIKHLIQVKQGSLKTKVVIATIIMGIALVSLGGISNLNYNSSTSSADKYIQVFGSAVKQPVLVYKTQYGVTTSSVSIRTGASDTYSTQGTFANKTNLSILATCGSFYKVSYSGKTGYVSNQYVRITAKPVVVVTPPTVYKIQYCVATGDGISIRTGAGIQYTWQGSFALGTKINIIGTAGSFYKVSYSGKTGYVSNQYVKIIANPVVVTPVQVTAVSLNKSTDTLIAGDTDNLTSTITPNNAVNKDVTWTSSNASIATVDNIGKVKAVSAGTATIIATTVDGSKIATCIVTVNSSITDNTVITSKFTDPTFKTEVYSLIGKIDTAPILYSDVKNIKAVNLFYLNISSLNGIEYFTGLTQLACYNTQLRTLDISKNTALTSLWCGCNKLTTLDVSKNTALTYLDFTSNYLKTLDISKNKALTYLDFASNQLTTLDISKNKALISLACGSNQLKTLDVSKNTALYDLNCYNNQLTTLDISKNTALTSLVCYNNQLTTLYSIKNDWDIANYRPQYTDSTHTTTTDSLVITIKK